MELSYVAAEINGGDRTTYAILTSKGQLIHSDVNYEAGDGSGRVYNRDVRGVDADILKSHIRSYLNRKRTDLVNDPANTSDDVTLRVYSGDIADLSAVQMGFFQAGTRRPGQITADVMAEIATKMRGGIPANLGAVKNYQHEYGGYDAHLPIFEKSFDRLLSNGPLDGPDSEFLGKNKAEKLPKGAFKNGTAPKSSAAKGAPKPKDEKFVIESGEKFIRPNGEEYRPRDFHGHTDVAFLRNMRTSNIAMRISGPPGSGKTALVEAAFPDCITVSGHGDMSVADFVGTDRQVKERIMDESGRVINAVTSWEWEDGPLVTAMKEGKVFFIDEATRVPTEVMNILFSVMDGRGVLRVDARPDDPIVKAAPGFYAVMGYNPATLGARALDEALISRFRMMMHVETDFTTALTLKVPRDAVKVAEKMFTRNKESLREGGVGYWVPQMRELLTFRDLINSGVGTDIAMMNLVASCPDEDSVEALTEAIQKVTTLRELSVPALGGCI